MIARRLFLYILFIFSLPALGNDLAVTLRVIPEFHSLDRHSAFSVPEPYNPFAEKISRQELELGYNLAGFHALGTLSHHIENGKKPNYTSVLNEFYLDFELADEEFSIGKKILSWGVGFGFRPLDVLQRENRRRLYLQLIEGLPSLIWEKFSERSALTVVYANPGAGQEAKVLDDESIALKYYQLIGDTDVQAVTRWSEKNHFEVGGGLTQIVNQNLEWHGALLYQRRYAKALNRLLVEENELLATTNPIENHHFEDAIKALLGFSWTSVNGWSTLLEAWYDEAAYSEQEWLAVLQLTQNQRVLLDQVGIPESAVFGNIAFSSQLFSPINLLQKNLLIRFSRVGQSLTPSIDILYTPEDKGWVLSTNLGYEGNQQHVDFSVRYFGGSDTAAFRQLPEKFVGLIGWQWSF